MVEEGMEMEDSKVETLEMVEVETMEEKDS